MIYEMPSFSLYPRSNPYKRRPTGVRNSNSTTIQINYMSSFCFFPPGNSETTDALEYFTESLSKFTRFSGFRPLATLSYASEVHNGSSIVSRYVSCLVMELACLFACLFLLIFLFVCLFVCNESSSHLQY